MRLPFLTLLMIITILPMLITTYLVFITYLPKAVATLPRYYT